MFCLQSVKLSQYLDLFFFIHPKKGDSATKMQVRMGVKKNEKTSEGTRNQ